MLCLCRAADGGRLSQLCDGTQSCHWCAQWAVAKSPMVMQKLLSHGIHCGSRPPARCLHLFSVCKQLHLRHLMHPWPQSFRADVSICDAIFAIHNISPMGAPKSAARCEMYSAYCLHCQDLALPLLSPFPRSMCLYPRWWPLWRRGVPSAIHMFDDLDTAAPTCLHFTSSEWSKARQQTPRVIQTHRHLTRTGL